MYKKLTFISMIVIIIDQIIKLLVNNFLTLSESNIIINNFFNITYVRNTGAAWSILSGNKILLILIGVVALFLIFIFFIKGEKLNNLNIIIYSLLMGGIIGNLIDRIIHGYVIDYLDFNIFGYNYPVFNFADICIVVSVILLMIKILKEDLCKKLK